MSKGGNDTIIDNYYNDGERYVSINIKTSLGYNTYIFQYSGDQHDWDTFKYSSISMFFGEQFLAAACKEVIRYINYLIL